MSTVKAEVSIKIKQSYSSLVLLVGHISSFALANSAFEVSSGYGLVGFAGFFTRREAHFCVKLFLVNAKFQGNCTFGVEFQNGSGGHPASFKNLLADVELIEHTFVYSNTVARDYHTNYWSDRQVLAS